MSPTKLNRSMSTASSANTPVSGGPTGNPKPVNGFLTPTTPASQLRTPSEKTGGPPVKGNLMSMKVVNTYYFKPDHLNRGLG